MKRTYKSITDQQSSKEKSPHYYQLDRNLDKVMKLGKYVITLI